VNVTGKRILVTGGASGIGAAAVLALARGGARLAIADIDVESGRRVEEAARAIGGDVWFCPVDIADEAGCAALLQEVAARWGALDVLIGCAGILRGAFVGVDDLEASTFDAVIGVNLRGSFLTVKQAVPLLRKGRNPLIILLASGAGVAGGSSSVAYGSSKGGVHGLAMVLEQHLRAEGIRVLDVCPGSVDTPLKRANVGDGARARGADPEAALAAAHLTDPALLGNLLRFLASDEGAAVRGTVFTH
jgi:NAD(P)-dependent dehydrogenase (short-subunit alcohol dehydrogenase family)